MENNKSNARKYIIVENTETKKTVKFEVVSDKELTMIHPEKNEPIYQIIIGTEVIEIHGIGTHRSPSDAGKCLLECSRGCHGDLVCVAECAAMCATIIIN
jgi:hypothetical protein